MTVQMKLSSAQEEGLRLLRDFPGVTDDFMVCFNLGPQRKAIMGALCRRGLARWLHSVERWAITSAGHAWLKGQDVTHPYGGYAHYGCRCAGCLP